jgi:hypothetical protein
VFAYFGAENTDLFNDAHLLVAEEHDKLTPMHTDDPECAAKFGIKADSPSIMFFRTFETT